MGEDVHGPRMNILLLAIFEYNLPDRIIIECVFAQLPYLIRIPETPLTELESGSSTEPDAEKWREAMETETGTVEQTRTWK